MDLSARGASMAALMAAPIELELPGSKSHANRALVAACLAPGRSTLLAATPCDDVVHMVEGLGRMGFGVAWLDRERGTVEVEGGLPADPGARGELDCGEAGTTLRFLTALACAVPGTWRLSGAARLRERPLAPLVAALESLGARIESAGGQPPLTVHGGTLRPGTVELDASTSSQFVSALLLAGRALRDSIEPRIPGPLASPDYVDLTREVLADFAAGPRLDYAIEGDWSAWGPFAVLAELEGLELVASNLRADSRQADRRLPALVSALRGPGEREVDCGDTPDQLMNLAVLAALRQGTTRFVGAANLRLKESDRLGVLVREFRRAGVDLEEHADGVLVRGPARLRPAELDPEGDHRMAMAFALLRVREGGLRIADPGCVAKSYPRFFEDLERVLLQARA